MKTISNILKYICLGCLISCFFPVLVFADNNLSYYPVESGDCVNFTGVDGNNAVYRSFSGNNSDIRVVKIVQSGVRRLYAVSENTFMYSNTGEKTACTVANNNASTTNSGYYFGTLYTGALEVIAPTYTVDTSQSLYDWAIYYTFGEGAVEPEPTPVPIIWGLVRDPEYSTRIAGNGYAAKRNIDYLSWNNEVDSNGNDISECTINIKAVLGSWSGTTQEDLLNKSYNDFNIGSYSAINLGSVPASSGMFSVSWQRIINEAGWNFDSLYSHFEDNIFLKQGWYYQLQLVDPDGGTHQWQTLYTPLSSSAKSSETIINHNSFDQDIYQIYEELTQINNNTSITINIEDTDYTVQNPDNGDEPQEGVDLWDILKQMLNGIFQIIKNIAALPGKFLEMIQQLITPPQQISEEINTNFNNNMDVLEESQPGLVESMNAVEDLQDTLNESVNSFDGVPECVFTWDAVTLDLSAFNAGNVTFIAAGSFDFAASFMQMINGFGMTYSEYQFYVSAIIYAWILVFIYRHVYDFLAGTKES